MYNCTCSEPRCVHGYLTRQPFVGDLGTRVEQKGRREGVCEYMHGLPATGSDTPSDLCWCALRPGALDTWYLSTLRTVHPTRTIYSSFYSIQVPRYLDTQIEIGQGLCLLQDDNCQSAVHVLVCVPLSPSPLPALQPWKVPFPSLANLARQQITACGRFRYSFFGRKYRNIYRIAQEQKKQNQKAKKKKKRR